MGLKRTFLAGMAFALLLMGCAGFGYRFYAIEVPSYEGTLVADKTENDLPFKACEPNVSSKRPCVVMLTPEFFKLKEEVTQLRQALKDCQAERKTSSSES